MPTRGPARLTAICLAGEMRLPAIHVVRPPMPWSWIAGERPKRRPAYAWPSSCMSTPTNAATIHPTTRPGFRRFPALKSSIVKKNEPCTWTGILPKRNVSTVPMWACGGEK